MGVPLLGIMPISAFRFIGVDTLHVHVLTRACTCTCKCSSTGAQHHSAMPDVHVAKTLCIMGRQG